MEPERATFYTQPRRAEDCWQSACLTGFDGVIHFGKNSATPPTSASPFRSYKSFPHFISAEYRFQFPGLSSIFDLFRGRSYSFKRDELELLCLSIATGEYGLHKDATWVHNQEPDLLIEILWRIGFLRAQAVGGIKAVRRSGSSYVGPHQLGNLTLRNILRFQVHPMFRSYLGMKEARDAAVE